MPNRILRDWTDSESVEKLSWQAEVLFVRLIQKADDFGRYLAHPKLLKASLFPLRDSVRETDISRLLAECEEAGLIALYSSEDGQKSFLEIAKWRQHVRAGSSKYPAPPRRTGCGADAPHVLCTCSADAPHMRPYAESETKSKTETDTPQSPRPGGLKGRDPPGDREPPDPDGPTVGAVTHWVEPASRLCQAIGEAAGCQFTAKEIAGWTQAFHFLHSRKAVGTQDLVGFPDWYRGRLGDHWPGLPVLAKPADLVSKWPALMAAVERWKGGDRP